MNGTRRSGSGLPGWVSAAAGAVAVTGLVLGVWLATSGSDPGADPGAGAGPVAEQPDASTSSTSDGGIAEAIALFPTDDPQVDTSREVAVDPAGQWPTGSCSATADESARTAFVHGTERGLEYQRDLAVGWYADEASATSAFDALLAGFTACAGVAADATTTSQSGLGDAGQLIVLAVPADGWAEVTAAALTRVGSVVLLVVDHAAYTVESVPTPGEATSVIDQATRLLDELCRVDAARC